MVLSPSLPFSKGFHLTTLAPTCIPGYQLCDNSVGVLFNDYTRLIMYADGDSLQYIDKTAAESYLNVRTYPQTLNKKVSPRKSLFSALASCAGGLNIKRLAGGAVTSRRVSLSPPPLLAQITLLKYFRNYMSEHLLKAGANIARREGDELARLPYLSVWFRTKSAIVLHLTNGTVQINFFKVRPGAKPTPRRLSSAFCLLLTPVGFCPLPPPRPARTTPSSSCVRSWAPSPTLTRSGNSAPTSCLCWRSLAAARSWPAASTTPSSWWKK